MKKILVADDNGANRYFLESLLAGHGFIVQSAANGREALETARRERPDLLITDILMPVMDGFTLCRAWKADPVLKSVPLVFYTATYTEPKDEAFALSLGADHFLIKPQDPDALLNVVLKTIDRTPDDPAKPLGEEMEFFRRHNEILFTKLEKKMADTEAANRELRRLTGEHRLIMDNASDVICIFDASRRMTGMSAAIRPLTGYAPGKFIGRDFGVLRAFFDRPSFHRARAALDSVIAGRTIPLARFGFATADGSGVHFEIGAAPLAAGEGTAGAVCIARDVSERIRAEEEVRRLNAELEERVARRTAELLAANKELEGFTYSVSHDLRSPLRAIDGFVGILCEDHGLAMNAESRRACSVIRDNARRMGRLIDDLLSFSRLGRTGLARQPLDMGRMAAEAFRETAAPEERDRIDFSTDDLPVARGDPSMLRQVWLNLLSNAVKFSSRRERPVITVGGEQAGESAVYRVTDNGAGFDMEYADQLFGVFQRLHGRRDFDGTGVGLAIVKRIVERHGGRVWARGETGKGASFYFSLPRSAAGDGPIPNGEG